MGRSARSNEMRAASGQLLEPHKPLVGGRPGAGTGGRRTHGIAKAATEFGGRSLGARSGVKVSTVRSADTPAEIRTIPTYVHGDAVATLPRGPGGRAIQVAAAIFGQVDRSTVARMTGYGD